MDTKGGKRPGRGGDGGMNGEIGIDIHTLICIKWITNKNLLYKKINKIKFKNSKKKKKKAWRRAPAPLAHQSLQVQHSAHSRPCGEGPGPGGAGPPLLRGVSVRGGHVRCPGTVCASPSPPLMEVLSTLTSPGSETLLRKA